MHTSVRVKKREWSETSRGPNTFHWQPVFSIIPMTISLCMNIWDKQTSKAMQLWQKKEISLPNTFVLFSISLPTLLPFLPTIRLKRVLTHGRKYIKTILKICPITTLVVREYLIFSWEYLIFYCSNIINKHHFPNARSQKPNFSAVAIGQCLPKVQGKDGGEAPSQRQASLFGSPLIKSACCPCHCCLTKQDSRYAWYSRTQLVGSQHRPGTSSTSAVGLRCLLVAALSCSDSSSTLLWDHESGWHVPLQPPNSSPGHSPTGGSQRSITSYTEGERTMRPPPRAGRTYLLKLASSQNPWRWLRGAAQLHTSHAQSPAIGGGQPAGRAQTREERFLPEEKRRLFAPSFPPALLPCQVSSRRPSDPGSTGQGRGMPSSAGVKARGQGSGGGPRGRVAGSAPAGSRTRKR